MGIIELAHFILPLFTDQSYGYFLGMLNVLLLAPAAWWGMKRLSRAENFLCGDPLTKAEGMDTIYAAVAYK